MSAGDWIAVVSALVAAGSVVAALTGVRDQLRMATFIAYTDRYSTIMSRLPFAARQPGSGYELAAATQEEAVETLGAFRDYFNLCSEELWLYKTGKIDKDTWQIWKLGMQQVTAFPAFEDAWSALRPEYVAYGDFVDFIEQEIVTQTVRD
jgi:hypothetical protein